MDCQNKRIGNVLIDYTFFTLVFMICLPLLVNIISGLIFLENPGPVVVLLLLPGILYLVYRLKLAFHIRKYYINEN
ncbi:MAG: hypothetical protein APR63_01705 [Desulfuromonas sp. SDB]|nr:MAG: hypothetical protein APR63_01705 [Desulfuromonas sp. SDB]